MRIPRIFHEGKLAEDVEVTLDERASAHVQRVLRLRPGAALRLFDGRGGEYEATIEGARRGGARVRVGRFHARDVESPLEITLAQGISRGERMDYTLQKAVELGVGRIVPLVTTRCQVVLEGERRARREGHWRGVVTHACEQSGRTRLPQVETIRTFADWLEGPVPPGTLRLVLDPGAQGGLTTVRERPAAIELLVGPEGGLTEDERDAARAAGCQPLRLGPRILRTETAGIAALAAAQTLWGDLG